MADETVANPPKSQRSTPPWQRIIWTGAGAALLVVILFLLALVAWTVARVTGIIIDRPDADLGFVMTSLGLVTLTLLRFLAILIGGAIAFAGLAVSFFTHDNVNTLGVGSEGAEKLLPKITMATYSPGIVGLIVGAVVIVSALYATSNHSYTGPSVVSVQPVNDLSAQQAEKMPGTKDVLGEK